MKTVYIFLSFTGTGVSRFIKFVTKAEYSHASIALIPSKHHLHSFGRRKLNNFFVGGFLNEDTEKHVLGRYPHAPCIIYSLDVSDEAYKNLQFMISECNREYSKYKYSFIGAATSFFGIKKRLKYRYTCSQFVAHLLHSSGAVVLPKHPSIMKPMDFLKLNGLKEVYRGEICNIHFDESSKTIFQNARNL